MLTYVTAFPGIHKRINCWAHCILIDSELNGVKDIEVRKHMRVDIVNIQLSNREIIFSKLIEIFVEKRSGENEKVDNFLDGDEREGGFLSI